MKIDNSKNYYKILGVTEDASEEEIKKSYKKLAIQWHPDKFVNESEEKKNEAHQKFTEINEANSILGDPDKKSQYDRLRQFRGFDPFMGGFSPFMNDIFRNPQSARPQKPLYPAGKPINLRVHLSIEDIYSYDKPKIITYNRPVRCSDCNGIGGTGTEVCEYCTGTGMVVEIKQQGMVTIQSSRPCSHCGGVGHKIKETCKTCNGTGLKNEVAEFDINKEIPKNYLFENNTTIRIPNLGGESRSPESSNGDILLYIIHNFDTTKYEIDELGNIYQKINIPYYECILGNDNYSFVGCDKMTHTIKLPKYSKSGIKVECEDMHGAEENAKYFIVVNVEMPNEISEAEQKSLEKIRKDKKKVK